MNYIILKIQLNGDSSVEDSFRMTSIFIGIIYSSEQSFNE